MSAALSAAEPEPFGHADPATEERAETRQYVTFTSAGKAYGIDIMSVREIRSWAPTTELPGQPHGARGVLDIRGEVIQVFDLNVLLGGGSSDVTDGHVVVVVSIGGVNAGILADSVSDIIQVGKDDIRKVPQSGGYSTDVVASLAKHEERIVAILDLTSIVCARGSEATYLDT